MTIITANGPMPKTAQAIRMAFQLGFRTGAIRYADSVAG